MQIGFDLDALFRVARRRDVRRPVYAGVIVLASPAMARKLGERHPRRRVPDAVLARLEHDPRAGVELACDFVDAIREHGGFAGVHLIPVGRYRETAAALEARRR